MSGELGHVPLHALSAHVHALLCSMIVIAGRGLSVPVQNSMGVENMNTDLQCIVIQTITGRLSIQLRLLKDQTAHLLCL